MNSNIIRISKEPLKGRRTILEFRQEKHLDYLYDTYNDTDFINYFRLGQTINISKRSLQLQIQKENSPGEKIKSCFDWVIMERVKDHPPELVGLASLNEYHPFHQRANIIVGIRGLQSKKSITALETTLLLMEFAFKTLQLNRLGSTVYSSNIHSQNTTTKLGFSQDGVLREYAYDNTNERHIDVYHNSLLRKEFWNNKKLKKLSERYLGRNITFQD